MIDLLSKEDGLIKSAAQSYRLAIKARDLACRRGGRLVFSGIDISLASGEGLLLEGANGSGKTSLLRVLAGLVAREAGDIVVEGGNDEKTLGEQAHYVAHADALKPQLSVAENLRFWADYLGGGDVGAGLAAFGLAQIADLPAAFLSAGQKRKLALSRLVAVRRPVWLLDEPSVSLDKAARDRLSDLMGQHMAQGGIIIVATHLDLGVAFHKRLEMSGRRA